MWIPKSRARRRMSFGFWGDVVFVARRWRFFLCDSVLEVICLDVESNFIGVVGFD
jgi:hypothetical protein